MADSITLHTAGNAHTPPDYVTQVATMVRALLNKYVPIPLLNEVKGDLLLSLKDFHHQAHKRVGQVNLWEKATEQRWNTRQRNTTLSALSDPSDVDYWQEPDPVDPIEDWYWLRTNLYDTISSHPEVNSSHNQLKHFFDNLEMEFFCVMHGLCKKDTHTIPKIDRALATSLQQLSEDPVWSLIQANKTSHWIPICIIDYIADMEIHLRCYCNEINWLQLDQIYKNTTAIVDEIEDYCSDGEVNILRSWIKTKKMPSVCLSIKDYKPLQPNECHSTRLIVSAHNFTQCLSKLASNQSNTHSDMLTSILNIIPSKTCLL